MPFHLTLTLDYDSDTHWRWLLSDAAGRFLTDQEVTLDRRDPLHSAFEDLPSYLRFYENVRPPEQVLAEMGVWIGEKVFGAVGENLLDYEQSPACVVQVRMPPTAQNLLFRPFEFAHLNGKSLTERGFRLVYTVAQDKKPGSAVPKDVGQAEALRILGVFSLPRDATPLNLRQERHRIQQLVRNFVQTHGLAMELHLLQYGATRHLLADVLQEAPGWDVVHFSGHGSEGELILEKLDGTADRIDAEKLAELLRPARSRLKLLTLSACYSGAADLRAARAQIGLDNGPARVNASAETLNVLPSLGQRLAEELDCAVLAMRYPVLDNFATDLTLSLYNRMLEKKQPLPQALQLAITDALSPRHDPHLPDFSRSTPLLFGARAADLSLQAPQRQTSFELPQTGLFHFPAAPERFVGRLMPMLNASQVLAPESGKTGVLFYGMAGAGKTACALELAYAYDPQNLKRFTAFVWHKAPEENHDIADSLTQLALSMEKQLPGLELVGLMDDPQEFKDKALPRLRGLLQNKAILLVLDNLEGLLTASGGWRDSRWGDLMSVLLDHNGLSRLVLTSRRLPMSLTNHSRLQADSIHALSFQESVILARQLPHLKELFKSEPGREKLQRILRAAQGHPKLLELADATAADPTALEAHLARAETDNGQADVARTAFFVSGQSDQAEDVFVQELHRWTEGAAQSLSPTARLLAQFLARIEDTDRTLKVVQANWHDFLKRLIGERGEEKQPAPEPAWSDAKAALSESGLGLGVALNQVAQAGLVEIETSTSESELITAESLQTLLPILAAQDAEVAVMLTNSQDADLEKLWPHVQSALENPSDPVQGWLNTQLETATTHQFHIHPGVAEAILLSALPFVSSAVDHELGDYFIAMCQHGMRTEMQGGGALIVVGARRAAAYLLRAKRWEEGATLLEGMIHRDNNQATMALAIPLLRQIVEKSEGTQKLENKGVLANALIKASRYDEAETTLSQAIERAVGQSNFRLASSLAGYLPLLLLRVGRFEEALKATEEVIDYTRRAGLGAWTQLGNECKRLQVLNALGRYTEVLAAVEQHRLQMRDLPEESEATETVNIWNVREAMLDAGRGAAAGLEQWETTLALTAEIVEYMRKRNADEGDIAGACYNDYGALLRLRRYHEARALLESCRTVFERTGDVRLLGRVYGALADLEDDEDRPASAARFELTALRYKYLSVEPESCAISHNNLATYVERSGGSRDTMLAHMFAAGIIRLQISSGQLDMTIRNLARSHLTSAPTTFAHICSTVEQIEGVRFQELFAQLPKRAPDGDSAIQAVWEMVKAETESAEKKQKAGD